MRLLKKWDTREFEERDVPGKIKPKMVPIPGTGEPHECDRCGQAHEVYYLVENTAGKHHIVGSSCAKADSMERGKAFPEKKKSREIGTISVEDTLFRTITEGLDRGLVLRYERVIRLAIRRAMAGRSSNPDLAGSIVSALTEGLDPGQAAVLSRYRPAVLRAVHARLGSSCPSCSPCPGYCGEDRAVQGTLGSLSGWWGNRTEILFPRGGGGKAGLARLAAIYALIPVGQVLTSHDPITFAETPAYTRGLQERAYDRDQLEQIKVIRQAETLAPSLVANSNPDAVNGPPIINQAGMVLGGNSRSMSIKRVLTEGAGNPYTRYLSGEINACGGIYGLAGAPVENMILVRVVRGEYDPVRVSRDLNRSLTQTLSSSAEAVSIGRMLPPELFSLLGDAMFRAGEGATLTSALASESPQVLRILQKAGVVTQQNYGEFTTSRKGRATADLSSGGRQRIRDAVVGALVADKEFMALLSPAMEKLLEYIAPALMVLDTDDPGNESGYNLTGSLRAAIGITTNRPTTRLDVFEEQFRTAEMEFEEGSLQERYPALFADPLAAILAKWLIESQIKPSVAAKAVREYVQGTPKRGGTTMFGAAEDPETLRIRTLGGSFVVARTRIAEVESIGILRYLGGLR